MEKDYATVHCKFCHLGHDVKFGSFIKCPNTLKEGKEWYLALQGKEWTKGLVIQTESLKEIKGFLKGKRSQFIDCDFCRSPHEVLYGEYIICKKSIDLDDASAHYIALGESGEILQSSVYMEIHDFLEEGE